VQKYKNNQSVNATDMRALLKKVPLPKDSPLKSKIAELTEQFHRRHHRLQAMFLPFIDENRDAGGILNENFERSIISACINTSTNNSSMNGTDPTIFLDNHLAQSVGRSVANNDAHIFQEQI
jgi:hypothetical protein